MSLPTFFSISPLNPYYQGYDAANPSAPYANAYSYICGTIVWYYSSRSLAYQHANDMVIMGYDAVPLTNQDLWTPHPYQACMSRIYFYGVNVNTENQYLLIFELKQIAGTPHAQFFVNNDLVDTVQVTGIEQHAILLDCPGDGSGVSVWVRLASPSWTAAMAFRGVDCYLL